MNRLIICIILFLPLSAISGDYLDDSTYLGYKSYDKVRYQIELSNILSKNVRISHLTIRADSSWKNIDFNTSTIRARVDEITFENINSRINQIKGIAWFCQSQLEMDSLWLPSISFSFSQCFLSRIKSNYLSIDSGWTRIGSLGICNYDSVNIAGDLVANSLGFGSPIYLSKESFQNLYFYYFSFKYDIDKNRELVNYIDFKFVRNLTYLNDSANHFRINSNSLKPIQYVIYVDCKNSRSFDEFTRKIIPIFLNSPNSQSLGMVLGGSDSVLMFSRVPISPSDGKQDVSIYCYNRLIDQNYLIKEINKIDYSRCDYSILHEISCLDLQLFGTEKKVTLRFNGHLTKRQRKFIYKCTKRNNNIHLLDDTNH